MLTRTFVFLFTWFFISSSALAYTVQDRVEQFRTPVKQRLLPYFMKAGVAFPPQRLTLIGLKQEKILEVYATDVPGKPERLIRRYPILAASGRAGPKLRQGDLQVPEGLYQISALNPNSRFHLSLRVNYPNAADKKRARAEGRTNLGGDIMIHGNSVSIGCIAVGDTAAEELFVLVAEVKNKQVKVILSPVDFRVQKNQEEAESTSTRELYSRIRKELAHYVK